MIRNASFIAVVTVVGALSLTGCFSKRNFVKEIEKAAKNDNSELTAREEVHKTLPLPKNSKVEIRSVSGKLDIGVATGEEVDVTLVRKAKSSDVFQERKYSFEQKGDTLSLVAVKSGDGSGGVWGAVSNERQVQSEMKVLIPKGTKIVIGGVNGPATVSGVGGSLEARGINGSLNASGVGSPCDLSGINGDIEIEFVGSAKPMVTLRSSNSEAKVRFASAVDADIEARNCNGEFDVKLPSLTVTDNRRGHYLAKAGAGGGRIEVSNMNGSVTIESAGGKSDR